MKLIPSQQRQPWMVIHNVQATGWLFTCLTRLHEKGGGLGETKNGKRYLNNWFKLPFTFSEGLVKIPSLDLLRCLLNWALLAKKKKEREREREDALFLPPRFQSKDTPSPDLKKMYIYVSFISLLLLSSRLYQDNSNTVGWAIHCHKQHGRSHMMGLFQVWIHVQVWSSTK